MGPIDWSLVNRVWLEICAARIREPRTVMAQAIFETGWMRAPFLMSRNNLFGFRIVEYLRFETWQDSVRYYKNWQDRNLRAEDTDYHAFLQRIRYGAPGYVQNLRKLAWNRDCPAGDVPTTAGTDAQGAQGATVPIEAPPPGPAQAASASAP